MVLSGWLVVLGSTEAVDADGLTYEYSVYVYV